jgi:hypothetical protein
MLFMDPITKEKKAIPINSTNILKQYSCHVKPLTSPYPTVANVVTVQYNEVTYNKYLLVAS